MTTRWEKLNARLSAQGFANLPQWAATWLYWNARLYRVPGVTQWRAELKYRKTQKKFNLTTPIIVFQMGKVGSSSVYDALRDLDLDVPVYHAHVLNRFDVYADGVRRTRVAPQNDLAVIQEGRALRAQVDSPRWKQWALVSLVRAPIPRAISGFFESVDAFVPNFWERLAHNQITVAELQETFLQRYVDYSSVHWYDDQVRDVFGIDVFATPFSHTRGYATYENARARLLLLRLENLNQVGASALREFFHLPNMQLARKNSGEEKRYSALYQAFMDTLQLDAEYIQTMHRTRYAQHFYTPQELEAGVARWRAPQGAA